jgi:hypothetical protein
VRAGLLLLQLPSGPEWVGCERVRRRFCDCYNWEAVLDVSCWVSCTVAPLHERRFGEWVNRWVQRLGSFGSDTGVEMMLVIGAHY